MNTQNKLAIWISNNKQIDKIEQVKQRLSEMDIVIEDMFIVSNEDIVDSNYAKIDQFYINMQNIYIIYFTIEDLVSNRTSIKTDNIFLCASLEQIINSKLDKQFFDNIRIIQL